MQNALKKILGFGLNRPMPIDLPKLFIRAQKIAQSLMLGNHGLKRSGQGYDFWQFKPYEQGDDAAQIDWKNSAKSDHILLRKKEWQARQLCLFWVSPLRSMRYAEKYNDAALIALSLGQALIKSGETIGIANAPDLGRGSTQGYYKRFIEKLNQQDEQSALPLFDLKRLSHKTDIILLHDFLEPLDHLEKWIAQLKTRQLNIRLVQILDQSEIDLTLTGRVLFENTTGDKVKDLHHIESLIGEYKQNIQTHLIGFKSLARRYNCHHSLYIHGHQPIEQSILKLWKDMTRRHHV
jgi:uncharacterized protein (DUF58 family)